jgi:hypothetical protein
MSTETEIREIVSRYTRAADRRDGAAMAALYEADAIVEVHYHGPDGIDGGELLVGTRKPEDGWRAGTFGAQGTIKPIESGYYRFAFRRTDGAWRIRHQDVIHDIPYVF